MQSNGTAPRKDAITFERALSLAFDYGKFIAQLWSYYITLIVGIIGWLVTIRGQATQLDRFSRWTVIVAYLVITAIFAAVLSANHRELIKLMRVVHMLAKDDPDLLEIYGARVDPQMLRLLRLTLCLVLPVVAALVSAFICGITTKPR